MNDFQINKGVSYIGDNVVSDKDIILAVGVITYSKLQYKFPCVFQFFEECKLNENRLCKIPYHLNLNLKLTGFDLKREIILCILNEDYKSECRFLIGSSPPPNLPLMQEDEFSIMWLILCSFSLLIIFACTFALIFKNKYLNKMYNFI